MSIMNATTRMDSVAVLNPPFCSIAATWCAESEQALVSKQSSERLGNALFALANYLKTIQILDRNPIRFK